ncbi:MAG: class I SAM-dependent methyltransferase [Spirochaetales bacterium]|nr:class I SAM-dependent methyltransferase [Spirochaetales bacterium]
MNVYSAMARYYDEIFPFSPEAVGFIKNLLPDQLPEESVHWDLTGPCALPALTETSVVSPGLFDAGCATGSLGLALAEEGFRVLGIDVNEDMIAIAEERAQDARLSTAVCFKTGNIMHIGDIAGPGRFSAVVCFGNTLPHLCSLGDRLSFLKSASSVLVPGGALFLQMLNYDKIMKNRPRNLPAIDTPNLRFVRSYDYDSNGSCIEFSVSLTVKETEETFSGSVLLTPIFHDMLKDELAGCGFTKGNAFSGFARTPYDKNTSDVLLYAGYAGT